MLALNAACPTAAGAAPLRFLWRAIVVGVMLLTTTSAMQNATAPRRDVSKLPLRALPTDRLEDFVVERGDSFGYPTSRAELEKSIRELKAQRASAYFARRQAGDKPFYGDLPLACCFREYETEVGRTQLETWKEFERVRLQLPRLKTPQVFVVAASGSHNAQVAACEADGEPAIAYPYEPFWAAIYAGSGGSSPQKYVLDRVTIGKTAATISVYCPRRGFTTADVHPYWFFVPLGRLPQGDYLVQVRMVNDESTLASTSAKLQYATKTEEDIRGQYNNALSEFVSERSREWEKEDETHAAELQLRLERLADFVASQELSANERGLLVNDVTKLGAAADCSKDREFTPRHWRRTLEPPTPGKGVDLDYVNPVLDFPNTRWRKSNLRLEDIWLIAGHETDWYTSTTYRQGAELKNARDVAEPSERQRKIQAVLAAVKKTTGMQEDGKPLLSLIAAGSLDDAINAAYEVYVDGRERPKVLPAGEELWAVMVAPRSYLVRQIGTREYRDTRESNPIRQFRVHTSVYLGDADDIDEKSLPATLAFIPLGKHEAERAIAVMYDCNAVSCRQLGAAAKAAPLVDVRMPGTMMNRYNNDLCVGCWVRIETQGH